MSRRYVDFKIEIDGEEKDFRMYEPSLPDQKEASKVRNEAFSDALNSKAPLRSQLNTILKEQGAWDDVREKKFDELGKELSAGEKRLAEGGFSLEEARKLALSMQEIRHKRRSLMGEMSQLDNNTAEGQSENMSFNYLISACLVYNTNGKEERYFKDLEDYLNKSTTEIAYTAANKLATLVYQIGEDAEKNLPENKFLIDFDLADDQLRLINSDGKLIDANGRLVNEEGRFVDEEGNFVDVDGNRVTEEGAYDVEFKGFTKSDGTVVMGKPEPETPKEETAETSKEESESK